MGNFTCVNTWVAANAVLYSLRSRSEEHTSELQSQSNLVCRLLLEKKKKHTHRRAAPQQNHNARDGTPAPRCGNGRAIQGLKYGRLGLDDVAASQVHHTRVDQYATR